MPNYNPTWNGKSRNGRKLNSGDNEQAIIPSLVNEPNSESDFWAQSFLSGFSRIMAGYYNARDNTAFARDYMNNNPEVDWSDIKYATRTPFWNAYSSLGSSMSNISRAIMKLYF